MNKHIEEELEKLNKELEHRFNNVVALLLLGIKGEITEEEKTRLIKGEEEVALSVIRSALTSIYQRGREDLQKEIAHEQRKLLDGFAHPKDCPQCSPLPEYPREV